MHFLRTRFGYAGVMDEHETRLDAELASEATRLCRRYVDEIVLEFDLCPWAAPALQGDRVQISVITQQIDSASDYAAAATHAADRLDRAAAEPSFELVLLVFPRCHVGRLEFEKLQRTLRHELAARAGGGEVSFALAAFHPEAPVDAASPERLIPYLRRSPDPLLQAVRTSALRRVEGPRPSGTGFVSPELVLALAESPAPPEPLRLRIARANLATWHSVGAATLQTRIEAIHEDRRVSYRRILGDAQSEHNAPPSRT